MTATAIDTLWFGSHPDRQYRLRRQTPAEIAEWPVQPPADFVAWCIVERTSGEIRAFALPAGDGWGDCDEEIGPFFCQLGEHA